MIFSRLFALFSLIFMPFGVLGSLNARPIPAVFVMDESTGKVLHAANADHRVYPASLTKMMTLYLMFDAFEKGRLQWDTPIYFSRHAVGQAPSKLGMKAGQWVSAKQAMLALMVKSANDVAAAVAEHLGGTEAQFAQIMTRKARELGMSNTVFRNASGLPNSAQFTTARDMATLAKALRRQHPKYFRYFQTRDFHFRGQKYRNHNKLLGRVQGVDGIKTGYTGAAGFNLTTSACYKNHRIIAVVMGGISGRSRDAKMRNLLMLAYNRIESEMGLKTFKANPNRIVLAQKKMERGNASVMLAQSNTSRASNWGVQIGSFRSVVQAKRTANKALSHVKLALGIRPAVHLHKVRKGRITQPRLVALTETQAKNACHTLKRKQMSCLALRLKNPRLG